MPPNPPNKAHGFTMRKMSLWNMQIHKSEETNSWPPSQILGTPGVTPLHVQEHDLHEWVI